MDKKRRMCTILDENTRDERNEHKYDIAIALGMAQIGSANKTGVGRRSWYKWPEPGGPEGVSRLNNVHVFVFLCSVIICRLYKLTLSDQAQVTATDFSN
jgi:hypothetical protein